MAGRSMGVWADGGKHEESQAGRPVFGEVRPGVGSRGSSSCAPVEESPEQKGPAWGQSVSPKPSVAWDARRALLVGNAAVAVPLGIA